MDKKKILKDIVKKNDGKWGGMISGDMFNNVGMAPSTSRGISTPSQAFPKAASRMMTPPASLQRQAKSDTRYPAMQFQAQAPSKKNVPGHLPLNQ